MDMVVTRALTILGGLAASVAAVAQQPPYQAPPYPQQPPAYQQPTYPQPPPQYQQPQYPQQPPQYQQPQYPQQPPQYQQPQYPQQPPAYQQPYPQQPYPQPPPPGYQQPQYPPPYPQQPPYQQPYPPPPPPAYQQPHGYQQPPSTQKASAQSAKAHKSGLQYHALRFELGGGYTITQDDLSKTLQDGGNARAGLVWFPFEAIPFGFRFDASYSRFNQTIYSREQASAALGINNIAYGHEDQYGGDIDAEIDLRMGPNVKEYIFGGFGQYRRQTVYKQVTYESGVVCYFGCLPAFFPVVSTVQNTTAPWVQSWNAGVGFEFSLEDPVSFFIEARYMRLAPYSAQNTLIPIVVGLRF